MILNVFVNIGSLCRIEILFRMLAIVKAISHKKLHRTSNWTDVPALEVVNSSVSLVIVTRQSHHTPQPSQILAPFLDRVSKSS